MSGKGRDEFNARITTTPEKVVEFLERLADDDTFRRRFETSTVDALGEYGIGIPSEHIPEKVVAPPKAELAEMCDKLRAARDDDDKDLARFGDWGLIYFSFFGLRRFAPPPGG